MVHVGLIPDGNRRYCRQNDLELTYLPVVWLAMLTTLAEMARQEPLDVTELSLYVLSCENLSRDDGTPELVFDFLRQLDKHPHLNPATQTSLRFVFIGETTGIPADIRLLMTTWEHCTRTNPIRTNMALNYDARKDVQHAADREQTQIDLIIRPGGEQRLSGFYPMHSLYSELLFLPKLFPECTYDDYKMAIDTYRQRSRRFGT
mgnify:CR=1 FL=1